MAVSFAATKFNWTALNSNWFNYRQMVAARSISTINVPCQVALALRAFKLHTIIGLMTADAAIRQEVEMNPSMQCTLACSLGYRQSDIDPVKSPFDALIGLPLYSLYVHTWRTEQSVMDKGSRNRDWLVAPNIQTVDAPRSRKKTNLKKKFKGNLPWHSQPMMIITILSRAQVDLLATDWH